MHWVWRGEKMNWVERFCWNFLFSFTNFLFKRIKKEAFSFVPNDNCLIQHFRFTLTNRARLLSFQTIWKQSYLVIGIKAQIFFFSLSLVHFKKRVLLTNWLYGNHWGELLVDVESNGKWVGSTNIEVRAY